MQLMRIGPAGHERPAVRVRDEDLVEVGDLFEDFACDVSERAFQLERGGQWVKGKSAETFNPCGPVLVTADEVGDVGELGIAGLGTQRQHVVAAP